jgi:hypothetical protein
MTRIENGLITGIAMLVNDARRAQAKGSWR